MASITTTIPFQIRTKAGLKLFSAGVNPADEHDIAHPYVQRLLKAEVLTIAADEAATEEKAAKTTKSAAKA